MKNKIKPATLLLTVSLGLSFAEEPNRCDELAASPAAIRNNPVNISGVNIGNIQVQLAMDACKKAVGDV